MKTQRNILIAFLLNLGFSVFELLGGIFTGSVAIISDAIHDFGDAISIGASWFLEKKSKRNGLGHKEIAPLTADEVLKIVDGSREWMKHTDRPLVRELYSKMQSQGLRPKTIVDYTREPFVYAPGNVRVTLDYGIRTALRSVDFLNPDCVTIPAGNAPVILEVKWDAFLPNIIRDIVQLEGRHTSAFSKYAICRIYD